MTARPFPSKESASPARAPPPAAKEQDVPRRTEQPAQDRAVHRGAVAAPAAGELQSRHANANGRTVLRTPSHKETIKASNLRKIPQLKACPYWDRAVFMGRIIYRSQVANYDGGLVKYDGRIYYVNRSQIEALQPLRALGSAQADHRDRGLAIED